MSIFDIVLCVIIGLFGLYGIWRGIVYVVVSLVGSVVAVYLAARYYGPVADWLIGFTGWSPNFSKVLIFVISFVLINRLIVLAFWVFNKFLSILTALPIVKITDRLAGLAFGILEGALIIGIIFYFITRFPLGETFMGWVAASRVVPYTVTLASVFLPFVPDAIKALRSTIDGLK